MEEDAAIPDEQAGFWARTPRIRWLAWLLGILAWIGVVASGAAWWVHQTLLDTEGWVELVGPIVEEEEVADAVAQRIATELLDLVDVEGRLAERLPSPLDVLAVPLAGFAENFVADRVSDVVTAAPFQVIWEEANRVAHTAVVTFLRGGAGPVEVEGGVVTLDLREGVSAVLSEFGQRVGDLLGVDLSGLGSGDVLSTVADRLGIEIPEDFGEVVVFRSDRLEAAQSVVQLLDTLFWLLPLLTVLLFAAAVVLAIDRRRFGVALAIGAAVSGLVAWLITALLEQTLVNEIVAGRGRDAVGAVVATVAGSLRATFLLLSLVLAVVVVVVVLAQYRNGREQPSAEAESLEAVKDVPGQSE